MTDKDRLIELFKKIHYTPFPEMQIKANLGNQFTNYALDCIVDDFLANGVIVPPCKVGETLYFLYDNTFANRPNSTPHIYETKDWYFDIDAKGTSILPRSIHSYKGKHHYYLGETVFLTKEEAEAELEKRGNENEKVY